MAAEKAAERIAAGTGFVAELEQVIGMGGLKFFGQFEDVLMGTADQTVAADFGGIRRRQGNGDLPACRQVLSLCTSRPV